MNIEINLLPDELRPRPPVETRTLLVIVLVLALAAGCFLLFQEKSDAQAEIADLEDRIEDIEQERDTITKDAEGLASSISRLKTLTRNYESFVASRIIWGDALERVRSHQPNRVDISALTEKGDTLVITGTADGGWDAVTSYGRALDRDTKFTLAGWPSWKTSTYSLTIEVAAGGAR